MRRRLAVLVLSTTIPALAGALGTGSPASSRGEVAGDTILRPDLDRPSPAVRVGLAASAEEPHVRLGLRRIPVSARGVGSRPQAVRTPDGVGPAETRPLVLLPLSEALLEWRVADLGRVADSTLFLPPPVPAVRVPTVDDGGRFVTEYADLAMNVRSRMELGGDWTRFQPCDLQYKVSCNPTLVPQLSPDLLFGVQLDGTIADRIRVDVDFDQAREFDAANRINIFYEGGEDDILRRLEVGDVTFRLPRSRFLTEGIPAGNFGFQGEGQFGPIEFQTVWAQQRGDLNTRAFQLTGLGDQKGFVQEDTLVLDDADYVRGQFFFLVDPSVIDRYPHIDALALDPSLAPAAIAPGDEPIQLYRFEDDPVFQQQVEGFIQADAVADDGVETVTESGWFRYLQPGVDYFVHPSGLWIALRAPLRSEEMLAVTFITALGDTVGDYNPERIANAGGRPQLRLLKASGANHQPGRPTWDLEMHQIYRVSSSPDVERASVQLTVSLGELSAGRTFKRRPSGEDITFLRLFGLDEEAPLDEVDASFVYAPGAEVFEDQPPVRGTFVVFPTLRPFAAPPPVLSLGLTELATASILGDDANDLIYEEEDPFERDNSGRFRLTLSYRLRSEGLISSFSLGAFGIRDGSERILLGDRLLTRGLDYEIDYDVGQVRLLEPEQLFSATPEASVRATWEQRSLFQVSPTQVFGMSAHSDLGQTGGLDFLALYRSERTVVRRPLLGTEPAAALLGGVSGSFESGVGWMDRVLDAIPGLRFDGRTSFSVDGELALSLPNPNTRGRAFVDDFDATAAVPVSLVFSNWALGSAPAFRDGAETVIPGNLDQGTAAPLTWQNAWILESFSGDSLDVHEGVFPRLDVDRQIRVAGSEVREPSLLLSLGGSPSGAPTVWRSVTTSLSTNGLDLTKSEFLEFYVSGSAGGALVLDLGTVSEDALFVDDEGAVAGTRADGRPWGLGLLDQEADPRRGEIWSAVTDALGLWNESCVGQRARIYRIGDPRAVCTRDNGRPDTEDLDADGNLDTAERHLRFVVALDGTSPYLSRVSTETGTEFQLYRIPIRGPQGVQVGGAITEADLRAVRHLRITVAGSPQRRIQIARLRLVGSRWIKRSGEGVLRGISGDTIDASGRLEVATVSRVTEGDAYVSPPGVLEELVDPTSAFSGQGIEFNEKSLGLSFDGLDPGARAEVYQRFPQSPRNFLAYREARMWVVARSGDFGSDRPLFFFFKVGNDPDNFYLYRTPLPAPPGGGALSTSDWLPEVAVDFGGWFELRRRAEEELLLGAAAPDEPVTVWSSDSTYAVVLKDRGSAPNLAAVRELSMGVWNLGTVPTGGEVWVDELRLGDPVRDGGLAASVDVAFDGAGVITSRLSVTNRGAYFRQLRAEPTYQTDRTIALQSRLALDRWLPSEWGLDLPLTLDLDRAAQAPRFLPGSDLQADRLRGLRATEARQTRVGLSVAKRTRTANPWIGFVIDGLDGRVAYTSAEGSTVTTRNESQSVNAGIGWSREPEAKEVEVFPGFAEGLVRALLPGFLEDRVLDSRLRLTPERVSIGSSYLRQDSRIFRFEKIIAQVGDSASVATRIPREIVQTAADVRLRPLSPLSAEFALLTTRDLLDADEVVTDPAVQALIRAQRGGAGGLDLGWETNRSLRTRVGFRPSLVSWLRHDFDWTTVYRSDRSANLLARTTVGADTALALARNASGQRDWGVSLALDPGRLALSWLGETDASESPDAGRLRSLMTAFRPVTARYQDGVSSRFNRDPVDPRWQYQLGWENADAFRFMDGDTAATVTDRSAWTLASGVALPRGGGVQVGYRWSESRTLDTRSDRRMLQRSWPDVQGRFPAVPLPAFTGLRTLTVSTGVARTTREIEFGGGRAAQRRFDEDVRVPLDVTLTWIRSVVMSYQGSFRSGRGSDPTGDTDRTEESHRVSLSSRLAAPSLLAARLDRPIQLSLLAGYGAERSCRITSAGEDCVAFVDQIRRTLSLSLDTGSSGLTVGLQISFDDRQSFVGQRTGSTQLQLGLFGQLDFAAGTFPVR